MRDELENERAGKRLGLEEAHRLAEAILRLDGLTGAEIEPAESVLSDEPADIQRLRQIAANHSISTLDFLARTGLPNKHLSRSVCAVSQRNYGIDAGANYRRALATISRTLSRASSSV